jgi:hypothetical protein
MLLRAGDGIKFGEELGETSSRGARVRSRDQRQLGIADGLKSIFDANTRCPRHSATRA